MLHRGEEDYIKTIYELSLETKNDLIKNHLLKERLGFTAQSVNEMVKKLALKDFLLFIPYQGVKLTKKGLKEAIRLVRSHRIWEVFLTTKLGFGWDEVHIEAENLEHSSSDKLIAKLYNLLNKPKYCSHGNPIPDENGKTSPIFTQTITSFNDGDHLIIKRVLDKQELLKYLSNNNLSINDELIINKIDKFNGTITFKNIDLVLSFKIANMIFAELT